MLVTGGTVKVGAPIGEVVCGAAVCGAVLPFEFKGAPTAMAQSWPGWPCGGFMPGAVAGGAVTAVGASFNSMVARGLSPFRSVASAEIGVGEEVVAGVVRLSAVAVSVLFVFLSSVQPKKQKSEAESKRVDAIFMNNKVCCFSGQD